MPWPTPQDYNEALQNPRFSFSDPDLSQGAPQLTPPPLSLPKPITGQFASVYRLICGPRSWAVRCFLTEVADLQDRYGAISQHLASARLPYTVAFDYLEEGIRIRGRWYPILKMEWVDGEPLLDYVQAHLGDPPSLQRLALRWVALVAALRQSSMAHGDLQHGNILVAGDDFKLVDYDGMYVPALRGRLSHELGHRNYQHPARSGADFGPYLDNFSAWSIYLSLAALGRDPTLWTRLHAGDERLLLGQEDYNPDRWSDALALLEAHDQPDIKALGSWFRSLLYFDPATVPPLDEGTLALFQPSFAQAQSKVAPPSAQVTQPNPAKAPSPVRLDSSWVLDHVTPDVPRAVQFTGPMQLPRLFSFLSLLALLAAVAWAAGASSLYGEAGSLNVAIDSLAVGVTLLAGLVLARSYALDPAMLEKRRLLQRLRREEEAVRGAERAARAAEKKRAALGSDQGRQRNKIEAELAQAQAREQEERTRAQLAMATDLQAINRRRVEIDPQEREALARLQGESTERAARLEREIQALAQAEAAELANRLQVLQAQYVEKWLKGRSVQEAYIPDVRYKSRSELIDTLIAHGVQTAYDVNFLRLETIPDFGAKRALALVAWRSALEFGARLQMPRELNRDDKKAIHERYAAARQAKEQERDQIPARQAQEEQAVRSGFQQERQALADRQKTLQAKMAAQAQAITGRYAPLYARLNQGLAEVAAGLDEKRRQAGDEIDEAQRKLAFASWQLTRARSDLAAYKPITFGRYMRTVWLGEPGSSFPSPKAGKESP